MNFLFLTKTWRQFFSEVLQNPQAYIVWVVVFLIVLFILSRLRNRMEERGVNKAIYISRGLVGSFIAFIVTPIVCYILINIIALVHGVRLIDVRFLSDWLGLTLSSYWWLLECFFNSVRVAYAQDIYSLDAIIRILWIILPISFIWLRMSNSRMGKLFLIPLIIFVFVITRYKTAPPTFITEDHEIISKTPLLKWFTPDNKTLTEGEIALVNSQQRGILALGFGSLLFVGFVVGLYFKRRLAGLFICLVGSLGFILMAPHQVEKNRTEHPFNSVDLPLLIVQMDSLFAVEGESVKVYELSLQIESLFDKKIASGAMIIFPDSLCIKYPNYFYDRCLD